MTTGNVTTLTDIYQAQPVQETLLVVDDNNILRDSLADILRLEGYQVVAAQNGRQALEIMEVLAPDLVLSDISMPEMDGVDFYRAVRQRPEWGTIPFIFLTAYSVKYEVAAAQELSAEDILVKPVEFELLINSIRSRLEH
jgi:two-component system sensor histidine kinase/response regulator